MHTVKQLSSGLAVFYAHCETAVQWVGHVSCTLWNSCPEGNWLESLLPAAAPLSSVHHGDCLWLGSTKYPVFNWHHSDIFFPLLFLLLLQLLLHCCLPHVYPLFFVTLSPSSASVSTWLHRLCVPGGTHFGYSQFEYPVDPFLVTTTVSTRLTLFCYNQCEYPVDPCVFITSVSTRLTPVCL